MERPPGHRPLPTGVPRGLTPPYTLSPREEASPFPADIDHSLLFALNDRLCPATEIVVRFVS